jgi:hypothetical protein
MSATCGSPRAEQVIVEIRYNVEADRRRCRRDSENPLAFRPLLKTCSAFYLVV